MCKRQEFAQRNSALFLGAFCPYTIKDDTLEVSYCSSSHYLICLLLKVRDVFMLHVVCFVTLNFNLIPVFCRRKRGGEQKL